MTIFFSKAQTDIKAIRPTVLFKTNDYIDYRGLHSNSLFQTNTVKLELIADNIVIIIICYFQVFHTI